MTIIKVDLSELSMSPGQRTVLAPYFASTVANRDGWIKMHCPIHGDANPSAGVNVNSGWFVCQACGERMPLAALIAREHEWKPPDYNRIIGEDPEWEPSTASRSLPTDSLPRERDLVDLSQRLLARYAPMMEYVEAQRGVDPETIKRYSIGYRLREHGGEFTMPVFHDGKLVNVRYYNPNPPERRPKILNHPGYGTIGLFPNNDIPVHAKLIIVEGEWDALATIMHLEKYGFTVRTFTNGTSAVRKLRGDHPLIQRIQATEPAEVWTIYDCDEPGQEAAEHLTRLLGSNNIVLPYPIAEDGGKDLTNFWNDRQGDPDAAERHLLDAMQNVRSSNTSSHPLPEATPRRPRKRQQRGTSTLQGHARRQGRGVQGKEGRPAESLRAVHAESLHSALTDPKYSYQLVTVTNIEVLDFAEVHYTIPKDGKVEACSRLASARTPACKRCPKYEGGAPPKWSLSVLKDDDARIINDLFGEPLSRRLPTIHGAKGICKNAISVVREDMVYRPMIVRQQGTMTDVLVYCLYEKNIQVEKLGRYTMTGRVVVSSKDQTRTLLIVDVKEEAKQAIEPPEILVAPPPDCEAEEMLEWIYNLADTIALRYTNIFKQTYLHASMMLLFTSMQALLVGERRQRESGRFDAAIIGRTRTGKTTVVREISRAFGVNGVELEDILVSGESVSEVGLTAGVDKINGRQYLKPGALPRNHGGYLFLDEQQALVRKVPKAMEALNTVRSSGIVDVKRVISGRFPAEVRFACIMNPPEQMGERLVEAVLVNYPEPEARARTDLVVTVSRVSQAEQQQMEEDLIGTSLPPIEQAQLEWHAYIARTTSPENVNIPRGGEFVRLLDQYCEEYAELYAPEHDHIGVMLPATVRLTLQRVAAAIANLVSSFDGENVVVTATHLECAKLFIDDLNELSGYAGLMREREAKHGALQQRIRNAVRRLLNTKGASDAQRKAARAFAERWNDEGFWVDSGNLRWGPWSAIESVIGEFYLQGVMIDKAGSSRNWIMHPDFRKAIGKALAERDE